MDDGTVDVAAVQAALSAHEFVLLRVCGRGGFGVVTLSQCLRSGAYVAVKLISKSRAASLGIADRVISEVSLHSRLRHPCVVDLLDFFEDEQYVYMVMNYACGGDAYQYVSRHGKLYMRDIAVFGAQLLQAIAYMHEHGVMHRDLKLSNLLLERQRDAFAGVATGDHAGDAAVTSSFIHGGSVYSDAEADEHERLHPLGCAPASPDAGGAPLSTRYSLRVADYGLAVQLASAQGAPTEHVTVCGTPAYMSPEVTAARPYGAAADMYSVGCLLFALAIGRAPQPNELLAESAYAELLRAHENSHDAQQLVSLIRSLAHPDAAARPTAAHALQHAFWSTLQTYTMNRAVHAAHDTSEPTQLSAIALLRAPQLELSTDSYAYPGRSGDVAAVAARALPRADTPTRRSHRHDSDVDETNALADLLDRNALMEVPSIAISTISADGRDRSPGVTASAAQAGLPSAEKVSRMHSQSQQNEPQQTSGHFGSSPRQNDDNVMAAADVTRDRAGALSRPPEATIPSPPAARSDDAAVASISPRPTLHSMPAASPPGPVAEMAGSEMALHATHPPATQADATTSERQQQTGPVARSISVEAQRTTLVPAAAPGQAVPMDVDAALPHAMPERADRLGVCLDSFSVSTIISDRTSAVEPHSIGELLDIVPQMPDARAFAPSAVTSSYLRSGPHPATLSLGSRSQPSVTVSSTSAESSWKSMSPTGVPGRRAGVSARDIAGYLHSPGSRHHTPGSFSPSFSETFSPNIPRGDVVLHALLEAQDISIPRIRSPSISTSDSDSSDYETPARRRASRRRIHASLPHVEASPQRTPSSLHHYQRSTSGAIKSPHELRALHSPSAVLSPPLAATAASSERDAMSTTPHPAHAMDTKDEAAFSRGAAAAHPAAHTPAPAEAQRQGSNEVTPHSHAIRAFAAADDAARSHHAAQSSAHRAAAYSAYVSRSAEADAAARIRGGADAAAGLVLGAARRSHGNNVPNEVTPDHANKAQASPAEAEGINPARTAFGAAPTAASAALPETLSKRQEREPAASPSAMPLPAEFQRLSVHSMPYEFDMSRHARLPAQVRCKRKDGTVVAVWKSGRVELHGSIAARGGIVALLMWTQLGTPAARNQEADSIISQQFLANSTVQVRIGKDQPAVEYPSPGRLPSALRASWNAMVAAVEALRSRCPRVAVVTPDAAGVLMDDGPLHTFHLTARQTAADEPWRVTYSLRTQQLVLTSPNGESTACYAVPPAHAKLVDAVAASALHKHTSQMPFVLSSPAHLPAHLIPLYTAALQLLAKCLSYQGAVVDDATTPDRNPKDLPWVARLRAPIMNEDAWRKLAALQSRPTVSTAAGASAARQVGDTSAGSHVEHKRTVVQSQKYEALAVTDAHTRPSGDVLDASFADGSMLSVNLSTGSIMYHDHPEGAAVPVTRTEAGIAGEESVDSALHEGSSGTLPDHVRARVRVLRDFLRTHTHVHDTSMASSGGSDSHIP